MTDENPNMRIWSAVEKTDPDQTKTVNQRGGFTAIGANYQIKSATEQFGPIGIGWGYVSGDPIFHDKFVIIPVTMWHGDRSNTFGPVYGCCEMLGNRPDADAPKKACTDGVTKLLSQLGFNADVFLGMFDDNKYVAELKREKQEAQPKPDPAITTADNMIAAIRQHGVSNVTGDLKFKADFAELEAANKEQWSRVKAEIDTKLAA